jgi:ATP-dependent Clp protease ATP-binding subunit ClpA
VFERFTEKAIRVIMLAQEEARRLGHNEVGTEQLLLGLIGEGTGVAAKTLKSFGVKLANARVEVEKLIGKGSGSKSDDVPFNEDAKRALEQSWEESKKLGNTHIGTEHLLLGIIREDKCVGCNALTNLGINLAELERLMVKSVGNPEGGVDPKSSATAWRQRPKPSVVANSDSGLDLENPSKKESKPSAAYPAEVILWHVVEVIGSAKEFALLTQQSKLAEVLAGHETDLSKELECLGFTKPKKELKQLKPSLPKPPTNAAPTKPYLDRFLQEPVKVMLLAEEESRRLGHNFVGTEQILIGLIRVRAGIAYVTLRSAGINLEDTRVEVEKIIGRGSGFVAADIPFTPRAKHVLELSWEEARQLGRDDIGTEHLLLGLIREGEGVASRVLENLGVDKKQLRSRLLVSKPTDDVE